MTRREYAISLGLAKPTRGRMSADAHAAIAAAEKGGMKFDEPVVKVSTPRVATPKPPRKSTAKQWHRGTVTLVADLDESAPAETEPEKDTRKPWEIPDRPRRLDRSAEVYETATGIRKSVRDCCSCGYSIGWCNCSVSHVFMGRDAAGNEILIPLSPVYAKR